MRFLTTLLLISSGVASSMVADIFLKKSNGLGNLWFITLGFIFYGLGAIPVALAFKRADFGSVFIIWGAITLISALTIASVVFKETLSASKASALIFALAALYLTSR